MAMLNLNDIGLVRRRIPAVARVTPLVDVSAPAGRPLYLKCENMQAGGAFKIRGAYNMVAQLSEEQRRRGVITYSSGNHGQALALAARELDAPAVVVMPTTAPAVKVEGARTFGAEVQFAGTTTLERQARAEEEAARRGLTIVPPFDDDRIIAGQATIGLEVLEALPETAAIVVPVGGGGLAAGIALAVKLSKPGVQVIGVEPSGAASMKASVDAGEPVTLPRTASIADGLLAVRPGNLTFDYVRRFVDRLVLVDEEAIVGALRWLFTRARLVAEPSGATALAAVLGSAAGLEPAAGPIVVIVSGGNISPARLAELVG